MRWFAANARQNLAGLGAMEVLKRPDLRRLSPAQRPWMIWTKEIASSAAKPNVSSIRISITRTIP